MSHSQRSRPPTRRLLLVLVAAALAGGIWFFAGRDEAAAIDPSRAPWEGAEGPRPSPVSTVVAKLTDLPEHLKAIGTVTPLNTVTVRSRVDGQLLEIVFDEGQMVKQGQVLALVDPAPYKIRLAQAEAQMRQNVAQLETVQRDLERFRELHGRDLFTTQQLEAQQALVREREAVVAANQAEVDDAKLQLAYTKIQAPISGRLGLRHVDAGNLIRANDQSGIVVITQTQPISVLFTIPEIDLQKVIDPLRAGEKLEVQAWDRSERNLLATGVLKTVDNQIDVATGTLRLKAEFANADERLFPNQFVNIRLRVRTLQDAVVIPGAAVLYGSRGTYVYVINEADEAIVRDVVLGSSDGTNQAITDGLKAGEPVVLEGLDRLREGRKVIITNQTGPAADS